MQVIARALAGATVLLLGLTTGALAQERRGPPDPAASRELPAPEVPAPVEGAAYLRVLAMGDWGMGTPDQKAVADAMARRAAAEPIDMVLTLGDNFYPVGVASPDDPLWERVFERVYDQPSLQVPWWVCLGNHDHLGSVDAQLQYATRSQRWKLPARYYQQRFEPGPGVSVELFVLDTDTLVRLGEPHKDQEQLDWLRAGLAASTARWKVVAGHHPVRSRSVRGDNQQLIARLEPILIEGKADLYLAGHDHVLELMRDRQGLTYVVSGGGAGPSGAYRVDWTEECQYAATGGGFVCLRFGRDDCVLEFVRLDAKTQFARVLTKPARQEQLGPY